MGCLTGAMGDARPEALPDAQAVERPRHRLSGLRGSVTALVSPFKNDQLDEDAFVLLCERQIDRGTAALLPCGTTGEAPSLRGDEQSRLIALAVAIAKGRVPVIAGAGSNCTRTAVDLVREAERLGADGVLSVTPYYNRPTQDGLFQHFKAIAACSSLPVILYDVPFRTGVGLSLETVERLAALPNIVGLKDATGDMGRAKRLRRVLGGGFLLFCGDDAKTPDYLALGDDGCISVIANVAPALCAALHRAWNGNDFHRFQYLRDLLGALSEAMFVESNPIPVKWALNRMGLIEDGLRLPMTPLAEIHRGPVQHALEAVALAELKEVEALYGHRARAEAAA